MLTWSMWNNFNLINFPCHTVVCGVHVLYVLKVDVFAALTRYTCMATGNLILAINALFVFFSGLPNYPSGVPFTFWEQYVNLRWYLTVCLLAVLGVVFVVVSLVFLNPWTGFLVLVSLGLMLLQLFGFMGWLGIKLSAVPAVILIVAVGIGVPFTMHFVLVSSCCVWSY